MAAAETARLIASLELQDKNFTRGIRNVERGVNRVDKKLGAFSGFVNRNMARAIDSIGVHLVSSVGQGLEELATLEDATTSVTGAIGQVGKGWETSAEDIATWANEIEASTDAAFDDKAIVASAATLIRYGKVSEDNLRPALEVMTDLAAKTGDTESAATLLGKALADPAKAAGKLARQGVILTKQQQKQIKAMVKAGDVAGAQTLLLEILSDTTKDAAKNSAGPYRDALNKLGDAGEDLRRSFAVGLLPVIEEVSTLLTTELAKPETLAALKGIGAGLADALRGIIGAAKQLPWKEIGTSLQIAGTAAKTILDAFLAMPPWVQAAVISGWGLNKITGGLIGDLASGLIKGVLGMTAGVVNINAGVVNGGGVPGVGAGGKGGGLLGGGGKLLFGLTGVGLAAMLASEFEDEIQGLADDLGRGWQDALGINIPKMLPKLPIPDEWPWGPKNTPTILPEIFGGNGLLGGTATPLRTNTGGGDRPSPGNPGEFARNLNKIGFDKWVTKAGEIKTAVTTASTEQNVALSGIKTGISTADTNTKTGLTAVGTGITTASTTAAAKAATQALKTDATTRGVGYNTTATRNVAPPIVSQLGTISSNITAAIWASGAANKPVIQSTNVVNNYTTQQRTGSTSGSRNGGALSTHRP